MTTRHDPDWTLTDTRYVCAAPEDPDEVIFDASYADAEAARQDATAPYEAPRCAADHAAERRVLDAKLRQARWFIEQVERALQRP